MSLLTDFLPASRRRPCPICGKDGWCLLERTNPDDPARVLCQRVESGRRWGEAGWLHQRHKGPVHAHRRSLSVLHRGGNADHFADLARRAQAHVTDATRHSLASELGVAAGAFERLELGLAGGELLRECGIHHGGHAWTFPMRDARDRVVGVRIRLANGRKLAVKGSRQGLFIPRDLPVHGQRLVIAEGPTDTAALLGLGFDTVGRPSCSGGVQLLERFVSAAKPGRIAILADSDKPGIAGAHGLARSLRPLCRDIVVAVPPDGVKDAREWVRSGATARDIECVLDEGKRIGLRVSIGEQRR